MKKIIYMTLIFLCLSFNIVKADPVVNNVLKEGIYKASDITQTLGNVKTIQNTSPDKTVTLIMLDETQAIVQVIKMNPKSPKYDLLNLSSNYKIVIVGDGSAFIS